MTFMTLTSFPLRGTEEFFCTFSFVTLNKKKPKKLRNDSLSLLQITLSNTVRKLKFKINLNLNGNLKMNKRVLKILNVLNI